MDNSTPWFVPLLIGVSGAIATFITLWANREHRHTQASKNITTMFGDLAKELREELQREREARSRLETRLRAVEAELNQIREVRTRLEMQLRDLGVEPDLGPDPA